MREVYHKRSTVHVTARAARQLIGHDVRYRGRIIGAVVDAVPTDSGRATRITVVRTNTTKVTDLSLITITRPKATEA